MRLEVMSASEGRPLMIAKKQFTANFASIHKIREYLSMDLRLRLRRQRSRYHLKVLSSSDCKLEDCPLPATLEASPVFSSRVSAKLRLFAPRENLELRKNFDSKSIALKRFQAFGSSGKNLQARKERRAQQKHINDIQGIMTTPAGTVPIKLTSTSASSSLITAPWWPIDLAVVGRQHLLLGHNYMAIMMLMLIGGSFIQVSEAVDCFKCSSRNGSNPACEDPFHNLNTTRITSPVLPDQQPNVIYHTPCYAGKKGKEGLFPASACIKLTGTFDATGETLVVRHCALDSGTLTQDTELARMSHCGKFQFEGDLLRGCVLACPEDACNSATRVSGLFTRMNTYLFAWIILWSIISLQADRFLHRDMI